jgi:hypothetical protein
MLPCQLRRQHFAIWRHLLLPLLLHAFLLLCHLLLVMLQDVCLLRQLLLPVSVLLPMPSCYMLLLASKNSTRRQCLLQLLL